MLIQKFIENVSISFYFMRDNHTFIKINPSSLESLKEILIKTAKENPYGMICPVTIGDKTTNKEIRRTGSCCHVDQFGNCDIDSWFRTIQDDVDIKHFFKKKKKHV